MKSQWSNDIADFNNMSSDINVEGLFEKLDAISFNTTQKGMNNLWQHLNDNIYIYPMLGADSRFWLANNREVYVHVSHVWRHQREK